MKSRKAIYSKINSIEQLRAERNSLNWHIKGMEQQMAEELNPSNLLARVGVPKGGSGFAAWLPFVVPAVVGSITLLLRTRKKH